MVIAAIEATEAMGGTIHPAVGLEDIITVTMGTLKNITDPAAAKAVVTIVPPPTDAAH